MACKTSADAYERLVSARTGCFVRPREAYLIRLRAGLFEWIESIDVELSKVAAEQARKDNADDR